LGYLKHLGQLVGLRPEIDWHIDSVKLCRREISLDALVGVNLHDCYPISGSDAHRRESVGQPVDTLCQAFKGDGLAVEYHSWTVWNDGAGYGQKF
jgi:hypothetical protein